MDEGHVIADSLGGVYNAYNIAPHNSTLNRDGGQAYMEKVIRDASGCSDFTAVITYPSTITQIPSHYNYTYTLKGNVINDEFDNVNPDQVNQGLGLTDQNGQKTTGVIISELDKKAEYIVIKNAGTSAVDLTGWKIVSVRGNQTFTFPAFILVADAAVKIGDSATNTGLGFH